MVLKGGPRVMALAVLLMLLLAGCMDGTGNETDGDGNDMGENTDGAADGDDGGDAEPTNSTDPGNDPPPDNGTDDTEPEPEGTTHTVTIGGQRSGTLADYAPATIEIEVGDSVVWDNVDSTTHTATATDEDERDWFDTDRIRGGEESTAIVFDTVGTFTYHCALHPTTMSGAEVVVTEAT